MISYFCEKLGVFVYAGIYPDLNIQAIPCPEETLKLKFWKSLIQVVNCEEQRKKRIELESEIRRTKERKIGEVVAKVLKWRKIYDEGSKMSLEEAAKHVGMSKKSLDDYLL